MSQNRIKASGGDNFAAWITSPAGREYFGTAFAFKMDILAAWLDGENLSAVAREHGRSPAAASKLGRRCRACFSVATKSS